MRYKLLASGVFVRYQEFIETPPQLSPDKGMVWVEAPESVQTPTEKTLEELKADKLIDITNRFEEAISQLKLGFSTSEILSWDKQEKEARSYLLDNTSPTPLLNSIALARGVDLNILVGKIIEKADMFATISGALIGKKQRLDDMIASATLESINNISWDNV